MTKMFTYAKLWTPELHFSLCLAQSRIHKLSNLVSRCRVTLPGAPLTYFNDGGGPTEVHILYPKKSQLQNLSTQKNPSVFLHQQILLFIFWKAKTCQLQLWFWSKTKL